MQRLDFYEPSQMTVWHVGSPIPRKFVSVSATWLEGDTVCNGMAYRIMEFEPPVTLGRLDGPSYVGYLPNRIPRTGFGNPTLLWTIGSRWFLAEFPRFGDRRTITWFGDLAVVTEQIESQHYFEAAIVVEDSRDYCTDTYSDAPVTEGFEVATWNRIFRKARSSRLHRAAMYHDSGIFSFTECSQDHGMSRTPIKMYDSGESPEYVWADLQHQIQMHGNRICVESQDVS